MEDRGWQHFPHGADLGVCGWGPTIEASFEEAAKAMTAAITTAAVRPTTRVDVECKSANPELLFVAWLNAIIYEMAVRRMLFGTFEARITGNQLTGVISGEPVDRARHEPACEPKGATFTALKVGQDASGRWSACCVVDV
jgi:tRNA nucleotidyltransferase (CCA-adding enzyme)